jgi:hypothetical protein
MNFMSYSSYVLIVGLWGGPFLSDVYGYGLTARGDLLMLPRSATSSASWLWGMPSAISAPTSRWCSPARWRPRRRSDCSRARQARAAHAGDLADGVRLPSGLPAGADRARALDSCRRTSSDAA